MRIRNTIVTCCIVAIAAFAAIGAPGDQRSSIKLGWDYTWGPGELMTNASGDVVAGFVLYRESPTGLVRVTTAPHQAREVELTNVTPGAHVFRLTATNYWGESGVSNPAMTPTVLSNAPGLLRITINLIP